MGQQLSRVAPVDVEAPTPRTMAKLPENPFVNRTPSFPLLHALILLPLFALRLALFVACALSAALFSNLACLGLSLSDPLPPSRRPLLLPVAFFLRALLFSLGYHFVHERGAPDPSVRIFVSNHSSFVETVFFAYRLRSAAVSRSENLRIPVVGAITTALRCIFVDRTSPASRAATVAEIRRRANDPAFPPLLVFPEGTTTNGRAIISFKTGAFTPSLPVQPVLLRYKFRSLDPSFVTAGPGLGGLVARLASQVYNRLEVEWLPTHTPSPEEVRDPAVFASAVRRAMASGLGVCATEHSYDDVRLQLRAMEMGYPPGAVVLEVGALAALKGFNSAKAAELLKRFAKVDGGAKGYLDEADLARELDLPPSVAAVLFNRLDLNSNGQIDFREFVVSAARASEMATADVLRVAFAAFDDNSDGVIDRGEFEATLRKAIPDVSEPQVVRLFEKVDTDGDGRIVLEEFEAFLKDNPLFVDAIFKIDAS